MNKCTDVELMRRRAAAFADVCVIDMQTAVCRSYHDINEMGDALDTCQNVSLHMG